MKWQVDRLQFPIREEWINYRNLSLIEHPHGGLIAFVRFQHPISETKQTNIISGYYFEEKSSTWNRIGDLMPYSSFHESFSQITYLNLMGNLHMMVNFEHQLTQQFSYDYGKSWHPSEIILEDMISWELKNRPLFVQLGRVLLPVFDAGSGRSFAYISDDTGNSWFPSVFIEPSEESMEDSDFEEISPQGLRSPVFIQAGERKILCIMQSQNRPNLAQAISNDFGETWSSAVEIKIPSGSGGIDAIRLRDRNGDYTPVVALAYGEKKKNGKYALKLAISTDVADTWSETEVIEEFSALYTDVALLQTDDNKLHVLYSTSIQVRHLILHDFVIL